MKNNEKEDQEEKSSSVVKRGFKIIEQDHNDSGLKSGVVIFAVEMDENGNNIAQLQRCAGTMGNILSSIEIMKKMIELCKDEMLAEATKDSHNSFQQKIIHKDTGEEIKDDSISSIVNEIKDLLKKKKP